MIKIIKAMIEGGFMPKCSYCAAMRYALISATLTGFVIGCGLEGRMVAYTVIGFWIGIIQVVFMYFHYKATQE